MARRMLLATVVAAMVLVGCGPGEDTRPAAEPRSVPCPPTAAGPCTARPIDGDPYSARIHDGQGRTIGAVSETPSMADPDAYVPPGALPAGATAVRCAPPEVTSTPVAGKVCYVTADGRRETVTWGP
jgi:hypothetical protein